MKPFSGGLALVSLALCLPLLAQDAATPSPSAAQPASVAALSANTVGLSNIRIVRLSEVRGTVQIDRHVGRGYEEAFVNLPITGGARLRTDVGLAEVEFEDNSSLRLTPDSEVEFTLLKRTAAGATISNMKVVRGMVYASLAKTKDNIFTLSAGENSMALMPSSHVRLTVAASDSNLSVMDGTVQFNDGSSTRALKRKESLDFSLIGYTPAKPVKLEETAFDAWDKNAADYQRQYSSLRSSGGTGLMYGTSDLNYYGGFVNMPGCGSLWRPYFASASWSPYDTGTWAYYPNVGYSWVSPYPWGWLPFHSGNWVSCGGAGWGWMPGSQWMGLQNVAAMTAPAGGVTRGTRLVPTAPRPPRGGAPAMVPVNTRPLAVSSVSGPGTFTFRRDSAGLGVPRDAFGSLKSISSDVGRHGEVHTDIERSFIGPRSGMANGNMPDGVRGANGRDMSPMGGGSRSVASFSRAGMNAGGMGNEGIPGSMQGASQGGSPGWSGSPRGMSQRGEMGGGAGPGFSRSSSAPSGPPPAPAASSAPAGGSSRK